MKKQGCSENTIEPIGKRLRNLAQRVNLDQPETVRELLARAWEWSTGYKQNLVNAYNHYAVVHGIAWKIPQYQRASSIQKVPLESDIDLIINHVLTTPFFFLLFIIIPCHDSDNDDNYRSDDKVVTTHSFIPLSESSGLTIPLFSMNPFSCSVGRPRSFPFCEGKTNLL